MTTHPLDNPVWASLSSRHKSLARSSAAVVRYPPTFAPFAAVSSANVDASASMASLVESDERVYLLGPMPSLPESWRLQQLALLAQMICPTRLDPVDGPKIIELSETHRTDVLALAVLVYPHCFRPRTMELGRYFGIYQQGRLAAMIGERMCMDGYQEISAVCTYPDYSGRGFARHLLAWLSNDNLERGRIPFLHVSQDNQRTLRLYAQNEYTLRCEIAFWSLHRA
jgi:ribosomal protein S18 acetylase RimI-like enzyme